MELSVDELLDEAKIMALELRIKDRQIAALKAQLEAAKKVNNVSAS